MGSSRRYGRDTHLTPTLSPDWAERERRVALHFSGEPGMDLKITGFSADEEAGDAMKGDLARLMAQFPRAGALKWIGIRPQRRIALLALTRVEVIAGSGLAADHYASKDGKRQVTLIQDEHLDVVAQMLGKSEVL